MSQAQMSDETEHAADRTEIVTAAVEWLRTELNDPDITGAENFLDVGGHSLTFSKLNIFLGGTFGAELDKKLTYERSLSEAVAGMTPVDRPETIEK
ncbi:hypothetical protein [Kutzneria buriramensis]|uniref:Phosphopantetheine binding protein n=1 Tax=Kutzneria buriramensis TaxID=1045776 RepID=A0A3E0HLM9_9PSEU|nr:hypothetical protein [Kutzneria buriramensis]REH46935.1 hypothetical protein BCF44_10699 [Kutzneria buriramensis]